MFVAWRDLRFARGRFLLIGAVVTLITVLVGFLSGLTAGLAGQNISAITALEADRVVFAGPAASWTDSRIDADQEQSWRQTPGVIAVEPLGVSQDEAAGTSPARVALFARSDISPGTVALSTPAAEQLGAAPGDAVTVGDATFTVAAVDGDDWYSHVPVVHQALSDWQRTAGSYATVLLVTGEPADAEVAGTVSTSVLGSLTALGSFQSEIGSLLLMVAMLFGISALVIGAFFTVWTIQRAGDIAVLKALGASQRMLLRDALGQALVVLAAGVGLGFVVTALLGTAAGTALPFVLSPLTTLLPAAILVLLGLVGAASALRLVTKADPLDALGSRR